MYTTTVVQCVSAWIFGAAGNECTTSYVCSRYNNTMTSIYVNAKDSIDTPSSVRTLLTAWLDTFHTQVIIGIDYLNPGLFQFARNGNRVSAGGQGSQSEAKKCAPAASCGSFGRRHFALRQLSHCNKQQAVGHLRKFDFEAPGLVGPPFPFLLLLALSDGRTDGQAGGRGKQQGGRRRKRGYGKFAESSSRWCIESRDAPRRAIREHGLAALKAERPLSVCRIWPRFSHPLEQTFTSGKNILASSPSSLSLAVHLVRMLAGERISEVHWKSKEPNPISEEKYARLDERLAS